MIDLLQNYKVIQKKKRNQLKKVYGLQLVMISFLQHVKVHCSLGNSPKLCYNLFSYCNSTKRLETQQSIKIRSASSIQSKYAPILIDLNEIIYLVILRSCLIVVVKAVKKKRHKKDVQSQQLIFLQNIGRYKNSLNTSK